MSSAESTGCKTKMHCGSKVLWHRSFSTSFHKQLPQSLVWPFLNLFHTRCWRLVKDVFGPVCFQSFLDHPNVAEANLKANLAGERGTAKSVGLG